MKVGRTTSAEKAVVLVFLVALPTGGLLGYNLKKVPEPKVEEKIVVRTVNVGDYDFEDETPAETTPAGCREAWDATLDVIETIDRYNDAVAQLQPILTGLYSQVMGNDPGNVGELNQLSEDINRHKRDDWDRLSVTGMQIDKLEATMRQCADVPE